MLYLKLLKVDSLFTAQKKTTSFDKPFMKWRRIYFNPILLLELFSISIECEQIQIHVTEVNVVCLFSDLPVVSYCPEIVTKLPESQLIQGFVGG